MILPSSSSGMSNLSMLLLSPSLLCRAFGLQRFESDAPCFEGFGGKSIVPQFCLVWTAKGDCTHRVGTVQMLLRLALQGYSNPAAQSSAVVAGRLSGRAGPQNRCLTPLCS